MFFNNNKKEYSKLSLLYATVAGLILSDIIPTPGDALYFYQIKKLRDKWKRGEITAKQFWAREIAGYYTYNSGWWLIFGTIIYFIPGGFKNKIKTAAILAGVGMVASVIYKNVKNDMRDELLDKELLAAKEN